jgi:hypothetical protein
LSFINGLWIEQSLSPKCGGECLQGSSETSWFRERARKSANRSKWLGSETYQYYRFSPQIQSMSFLQMLCTLKENGIKYSTHRRHVFANSSFWITPAQLKRRSWQSHPDSAFGASRLTTCLWFVSALCF